MKDNFFQSDKNNIKIKKKRFGSNDSLVIQNIEKDLSSKVISFVKNDSEKLGTGDIDLNSIKAKYNDQELNTMDYKNAIKYDKRTYIQYYWSLVKKKQLLLFTFIPNNDYNLILIKINLFLVSFSSYFTINGFFFNDESMHKIYINKGNYSILYQIPQILFSSAISVVINFSLKFLALSENDILKLKKEKEFKEIKRKSKEVQKCLKIKFIIFYILSILFLAFFWYFISCFCGIFINTQIFLIKDTLTSFLLTLIYPFGLSLIPGIFRIIALRDKKKNRNIIYIISKIIALF